MVLLIVGLIPDTDSCLYTTKIKLRNLYKVTFEDGSVKYVSKEELEKLK